MPHHPYVEDALERARRVLAPIEDFTSTPDGVRRLAMAAKEFIFKAQDGVRFVDDVKLGDRLDEILARVREDLEKLDRIVTRYALTQRSDD